MSRKKPMPTKSATPPQEPMTDREQMRMTVRALYDIQKLRIQTGNRIVANFKALLGQKPSTKEEDMEAKAKKILKMLRTRYKKMAKAVAENPDPVAIFGHPLITNEAQAGLILDYLSYEAAEDRHQKTIANLMGRFPIWTRYLKKVKGIGPQMAGVILSEINIAVSRYVSSLWKYAGLDVVMVDKKGEGRSRRATHLIDKTYTNSNGDEATRKSITFNPFLKTKLLGVLAPSFLKAKNATYSEIYCHVKRRYETDPRHADKTKGHRHNMAMRYMIKMFLAELYNVWRPLEGLDVAPTYQEAKQGHHHRDTEKAT